MPAAVQAQEENLIQGACCLNGGVCYWQSDLVCQIWGGTFYPNIPCANIECETNCDGACSPGEVYDCLGHCAPVTWVGDNTCDNGDYQWDTNSIYLNCEEHAWDGGDCQPPDPLPVGLGACRMQSVTDCDDPCICDVMSLEDCIAMGDGTFLGWGTTCMDAVCDCPPGFTSDCSGNCFPIHMLSNGICQDGEYYYSPAEDSPSFWLDFSCLELACDGGDCTGNCSGACCLGDTCSDSMSMIDCAEQGGVFLGPAYACTGVDCTDYLVPISLSQSLSSGNDLPNRSLSYNVSTAGGITACSFRQNESNQAAFNIYESISNTPTITIMPGITTNITPLIDTDGNRIVLSLNGQVLIYQDDGQEWVQEAILNTSFADIEHLLIEGDNLFVTSGSDAEIYQLNGNQWQYLRTLTGISGNIKSIDATGSSFAMVSAWFIQVYEYPYQPEDYIRVDLYGTSGDVDFAMDDNLMVVSEGPGYFYGWWDADLPGQVYIYSRSSPGLPYHLNSTLVALDAKPDDQFGSSVAIENGVALVTAPGHDGQAPNAGAVFIFRQIDGEWKQAGKIYPTTAFGEMGFGQTASIDDSLVSVGWARRNASGTPILSGAETIMLEEHEWINVDGGSIGSVSNWSPDAPDGDSPAAISIPMRIPISVAGSFPFDDLIVGSSRPEFDLQFQDATLGSDESGSIVIAGSQNFTGGLQVSNGTLTLDGSMLVGSAPYNPGALSIADSGLVHVEGDYTQAKIGELAVVLADRPEAALHVDGNITLQGTLSATCPAYNSDPEVGNSWTIIRCDSGIDSENDRFQIAVLPGVGNNKYIKVNYSQGLRGGVSIFLSVESIDGLFDVEASSNLAIEGMATDLVVADLGSPDGPADGFDDVALTIAGDPGSIYIFINDGAGGIDSQVTFTAGHNPSSIDSGDFDNDGTADLVVTNAEDDNVFMLLNNGGSIDSMSIQAAAATGDNPVDVAVLDIDTDGDVDVAVSCAGNGQVLPDGTIYGQVDFFECFQGSRSALTKVGEVQTGDQPGPIDPGELGNSKGGTKLVIALRTGNTAGSMGQTGDDGFDWELEETHVVGMDPNVLETGDLNNDGLDDVAVGNSDSGSVSILLSDGTGSLVPESTFAVGENPQSMTLLDYDGDMDLDLCVIAEVAPGENAVFLYRNDSTLNETCGVTFSLEQILEEGNDPILVGNGLLDNDVADDLVAITNNSLFRGSGEDNMTMSIMSADVESAGHCYLLGDVNMDNNVTIDDILLLLSAWGQNYFDLNGDLTVNVDDLLIVINNWGPCPRR